MSAELLSSIAGIALSLGFSYIPGVKDWFDALQSQHKQAIMGGLLVVVAGASFGLACAGIVDVGLTCDQGGASAMANILISALIANQSAYLITRK